MEPSSSNGRDRRDRDGVDALRLGPRPRCRDGVPPAGARRTARPAAAVVLLVVIFVLPHRDPVLEAARALGEGEDAWVVAHGLQGVDLEGRAGLCLGVAVRCLVEAGRQGRLEARLRKEGARWLREAIEEMK